MSNTICNSQNLEEHGFRDHPSQFIPSPLRSSMPGRQQSQSATPNRTRISCQSGRKSRSHCIGGRPCENCVRLGKKNCELVHTLPGKNLAAPEKRPDRQACLESHKEDLLRERRTCACLLCRLPKIRCTGGGPPYGTCTTGGVESTCVYMKTTKGDPEDIEMHTTQCHSDGESFRNDVLEAEATQQPESILDERPENRKYSAATLTSRLDPGYPCFLWS